MVLNRLKKIRDELKESAKSYDEAFRNTALIAAESLVTQKQLLDAELSHNSKPKLLGNGTNKVLPQTVTKEYFLQKYGS